MAKTGKICCIFGSFLLLVMAFFHGLGLTWISEEISNSNAKDFLKEVFPVLFIHVSIQLFGLSCLGVLAIFLGRRSYLVLIFIAVLVLANVALAFYLGALIPGLLLLAAVIFYLVAAMLPTDAAS